MLYAKKISTMSTNGKTSPDKTEKVRFPILEKACLTRDPPGLVKTPGKASQVRNIVIYGLEREAHRTPGSPSQVWRRIAKPPPRCGNPMGLRPSWVQIPLPAPSCPKQHALN